MSKIEWSDKLLLEFDPMDRQHRAFFERLGQVDTAPDATLEDAWTTMLGQAVEQFGREDEWMRKTRYGSAGNHMLQHRVVLNILREGLGMVRAHDVPPAREMVQELASWFSKHTQTEDAALALHLRGADNMTRSHAA